MKSIQQTIDDAKSILEQIQKRRQSSPSFSDEMILKNTSQEYQKVFDRLEKLSIQQSEITFSDCNYDAATFIKIARNVRTRVTWFKRKAAVFYCLKERLSSQVENRSRDKSQECIERDIEILRLLESMPPPFDSSEPTILSKKNIKKSGLNSKRNLLKHLPVNWREQIFEVENFRGDKECQLFNIALTGCRPDELLKGMRWKLEEGLLTATIEGSKYKKFAGQKFRKLSFSIFPHLLSKMFHTVFESGGEFVVSINNKKSFANYITNLGKHYFKDLKSNLTPYVFRHQFASDLKAYVNSSESTLTLKDISAALGHSTTEMKRLYGHIKQSKAGGLGLQKVEVERTIKQKLKATFKPNKKLKI